MAEINTTDYKDIATLYADATTQLTGISQKYFDAAYEIVILDTFDPTIDLLVPFFNAYLASEQAYANAPQSIVNAVRSLQEHILSRAKSRGNGIGDLAVTVDLKFSNINEWYSDEEASAASTFANQLPANFATISLQAGHRIEDGSAGDSEDFIA